MSRQVSRGSACEYQADEKAEAPILWPPDAKSQLIRKELGKIEKNIFSMLGKNWEKYFLNVSTVGKD